MKTLRVLSLFSGCGGMDLGFEGDFQVFVESVNLKVNKDWNCDAIEDGFVNLPRTRFTTCFANDIREGARNAWTNFFERRSLSAGIYRLESIVDIVKRFKRGEVDVFPSVIDVVTGGFPCQDFSIAGKRKGFYSDKGHDGKLIHEDAPTIESRGQLYMWMREVISIVKPKVFIAENVKGLTNLSNVKEIIERDFSSVADSGYIVIPAKVLHAARYGVPQNRERVIFYGFRKDALKAEALDALTKAKISPEYDPYPMPTHYLHEEEAGNGVLMPFVPARVAFRGLEEPDVTSDLSQQTFSKAKFMGRHCQGQTEVRLNGLAPTIRSEHHGNIEYRRLSIEHGGDHFGELLAGLKERRLTIRECARIQTFPDNYRFVIKDRDKKVSGSEAYKIIGNAVPPLLAYHIAKRLEKNWNLYFKGETYE